MPQENENPERETNLLIRGRKSEVKICLTCWQIPASISFRHIRAGLSDQHLPCLWGSFSPKEAGGGHSRSPKHQPPLTLASDRLQLRRERKFFWKANQNTCPNVSSSLFKQCKSSTVAWREEGAFPESLNQPQMNQTHRKGSKSFLGG